MNEATIELDELEFSGAQICSIRFLVGAKAGEWQNLEARMMGWIAGGRRPKMF